MKDREARWQSMQDVSAALGWIAEGIQSTAVARQPTRWRERAAWAIAVLACAALGVVTARWLASHPTDAPLAPDRVQIMTPPTGDPLSIALSPDGRKLVVAGRDDKIDRLFLYSLDTGLLQPIERTEGGTEPFWSSDSQSIGFFADGWLKLMNVSKGAVSSLTRVLSARGATWFDDVIVYSPYSIARLKRISASSGGAPVQLSGESARSPKFLPDGQHVLFYRTGSEDTAGVYVTDLAGREPKKVLDWHADGAAVPLDANHLLFVKQGTLFVQRFDHDHLELEGDPVAIDERVVSDQGLSSVTVSASGAIAFRKGEPVTRQFVWIDRAGKVLGPLGLPDPVPLNPELSHDGKKVVFQRAGPDRWDLWTMDARGASVRLTSDPARAWCPVWSPGGDRVAFSSDRKGQFDLYEKAAELGAADRLVFASSALKIPMDWSSNGYLLYRETDSKTGVDHLWAKAMEREELPIAVANTQADEREGQFSPDGHWVAYQSDEAAQGQFEIYVQRFPEATGRTRVSINGGAQVRWNANGHEIFYVAPDGRLIAAPFSVSSKDGQAVIGIPSALFQTDIVNGQVPGANKQQYVVAPDGQRFLVTRVAVQPASPVTLILHWTDRSNSTSTHSRTWQLLGALLLVGAALVFVYLRGRPRSGSASAVR